MTSTREAEARKPRGSASTTGLRPLLWARAMIMGMNTAMMAVELVTSR